MKLLICFLFTPLLSFSQLDIIKTVKAPELREIRSGSYSVHHFMPKKDSSLIVMFPDISPMRKGVHIEGFILKDRHDCIQLFNMIETTLDRKQFSDVFIIEALYDKKLHLEWAAKSLTLLVEGKDGPIGMMLCDKKIVRDLLKQLDDITPFK